MLYAFLVIVGILYISWYVYKRRKDHHLYQLIARFNKDEDFKRTLAMGLYYRFMKPVENESAHQYLYVKHHWNLKLLLLM